MKKVLAALALAAVLVLGTLASKQALKNHKTSVFPIDAIVRLHDSKTNRFFCSGTVISDKYVVTAGHCVGPQTFMGMPIAAGPSSVNIVFQNGSTSVAKVGGVSLQVDQAILIGNFAGKPQAVMETDPQKIEYAMLNHHIKACGFPLADALYCITLKKAEILGFFFAFDGQVWPGMSGGPAIDLETGKLIGTNFAMTESGKAVIAGTEDEYTSTDTKP